MSSFEEWFQSYLKDNHLVECNWGIDNLPPSIARQCATAAYHAARAAAFEECERIANKAMEGYYERCDAYHAEFDIAEAIRAAKGKL